MKSAYSLTILFSSFFSFVFSQDVHHSQYDVLQNRFNPAVSAHIEDKMQFAVNYRMQWFNLPFKYSTVQAEGLYKLQSGALKNFTVGLYLYQDMVMKTGLSNFGVHVNIAYPIIIKNHELSLGLLAGLINRSVNLADRTFPGQWDNATGTFDPQIDNNEDFGKTQKMMFDMGTGVSWKVKMRKSEVLTGLGIFHVNKPRDGILSNTARLGMLFNAHISYKVYLKDRKYSIEPKVRYQNTSGASEMNFGVEANIFFKPSSPEKKPNALIVGVLGRGGFRRTYDSVIPLAGYKYQNLKAIVSYDIHVGKFSNDFGVSSSIEFSLVYTVPNKQTTYHGVPCGIY